MKLIRLFSTGVWVLILSVCWLQEAKAQKKGNSNAYNSEALWKSYDHVAFHKDLQNKLGLDNLDYDAFQKYLILVKKTWKDEEVFFTKAHKGILNPTNINAFFDQLKKQYFGYYPSYLAYTDSVKRAAAERNFIGAVAAPGVLACGQPCTNPGFETNSFTAWNQSEGSSVSGSGMSGVSLSAGPSQTSITSAGPDPVVGAPLPMVYPGGGTHSAMVGNGPVTGAEAGGLSTSFTVSASTTNFTYAYGVVLEDPGHPVSDQPYFFLTLTDQGGNILACGDYSVTAGPGIPGFTQLPNTDIYYRPWTTVFVDLTPYVGQCVTLSFICRDCDQGGHYGYAYVDAACAPAQIVTSSPAICGSSTITLTAPAGASAYAWTGPGIVGANNTQIITVGVAGTYNVTLTSAVGGCTTNLSITVPGNPSVPTADFSALPVCAGTPMQFNDLSKPVGGITAWSWDFNADGTADATTQNPTYVFAAPGIYPVHLTITWPPCVHDTIINVAVNPLPVPAFTSTTGCVNTPIAFTTATAGTAYAWTFGDGGTSTLQNPTHPYTTSGTFSATLTVTAAGGCAGTVTQNVVVISSPSATFTASTVCLGTPTTFTNTSVNGTSYAWTFGDAGTAAVQTPTHTYAVAGTYSVTLLVTATGGCTNTVTVPVSVYGLPVAGFTNSSVCVNVATAFTDISTVGSPETINQWAWDFGDGTTGLAENPSHLFSTPGTFTVNLLATTDKQCMDTISHVVTIYPLPVVAFAGDSLLHCSPWCVNFTDASTVGVGTITHWTWNFGDGTPTVSQNVFGVEKHCYTSPGTYGVSLTVSSSKGCSSNLVKPAYVTTWPSPKAEFTSSEPGTLLQPIIKFTDLSTNAVAWNWHFGDGDSLSMLTQNPSHTYPSDDSSTYLAKLIVYSLHGCTDTIVHPVHIGPVFDFFAPNCYTPNDDGKNDLFFGYGVGISKYNLIVFDRWGNLIFQTNDLYTGWDGKVQGTGALCQEDTYIWKVVLTDCFYKPHTYIGHVSLIR
jgi:gliding motility-associated-like protein